MKIIDKIEKECNLGQYQDTNGNYHTVYDFYRIIDEVLWHIGYWMYNYFFINKNQVDSYNCGEFIEKFKKEIKEK